MGHEREIRDGRRDEGNVKKVGVKEETRELERREELMVNT